MSKGTGLIRLAVNDLRSGSYSGQNKDAVQWLEVRQRAFADYLERAWALDSASPGHPGAVESPGTRLVLTEVWGTSPAS